MITIRGAPLQLLGLSWTRARENRDVAIATAVRELLNQRQPESFPILLAHHPHAFDTAAAASVPLTLSGHTHGGQLMLNEQCGFGPALFRYWSGLYRKGASKLIVSNGVGNWFPLRYTRLRNFCISRFCVLNPLSLSFNGFRIQFF